MAETIRTQEAHMLLEIHNKVFYEETSPLFAQLSTQQSVYIP